MKDAGSKPVLIQYYALWCGYCKKSIPIVKELAEQYATKLVVLLVDHEKFPEFWPSNYGKFKGYPTFVFLKNGLKTNMMTGWNKTKLEDTIKSAIN